MTGTAETMTFEEQVRKRPAMFIGNDGALGLLKGLIIDCIQLCGTDEITFEIAITSNDDFIVGIATQINADRFWERFSSDSSDFKNYFPSVLKAISSAFEIRTIHPSKWEIHFSIDKEVIYNTTVDYLKLSEKVFQIALLNRRCEIIIRDNREKHFSQNYYHFPQGVFYLLDRATAEVPGKPEFSLTVDHKIDGNAYQIGLAYRRDWYPAPDITSFANDVYTVCGGSLVDGILDGLVSAVRAYVKENGLATYSVTRKKFLNGLVLVCAVRGQDFSYGGSRRETLEDDKLRQAIKKLITELALNFFRTQKEKADKFLWRFDTTKLTSGMF